MSHHQAHLSRQQPCSVAMRASPFGVQDFCVINSPGLASEMTCSPKKASPSKCRVCTTEPRRLPRPYTGCGLVHTSRFCLDSHTGRRPHRKTASAPSFMRGAGRASECRVSVPGALYACPAGCSVPHARLASPHHLLCGGRELGRQVRPHTLTCLFLTVTHGHPGSGHPANVTRSESHG